MLFSNFYRSALVQLTVPAIVLAVLVVKPAWSDDSAALYNQRCAACHGTNGKGDGPTAKFLHPPPTDFAKSIKGKSGAWLFKAIQDGGPAVGEAATMPPYKDLSDGDIKGLVSYITKFSGS
jgi:mono/diheme cytochrome c family protein